MATSSINCRRTQWKGRPGYCLNNGRVQMTALTGGGAMADLRCRCGTDEWSPNLLWEAPWPTMDPVNFQRRHSRQYGPPFVGKFLAGLAGNTLCLDYFGAPSEDEIRQGLCLHGEASVMRWKVCRREPRRPHDGRAASSRWTCLPARDERPGRRVGDLCAGNGQQSQVSRSFPALGSARHFRSAVFAGRRQRDRRFRRRAERRGPTGTRERACWRTIVNSSGPSLRRRVVGVRTSRNRSFKPEQAWWQPSFSIATAPGHTLRCSTFV